MHAVGEVCDRALVLDGGRVAFDGATAEAIARYRSLMAADAAAPRGS
jgi:ABC-type polysaccharide/polyol phosphate transport system ATPase subunit